MQKITPFLWFDNQAEEAVKFYASVFKDSKITTSLRHSKDTANASGLNEGDILTINFELGGLRLTALNGGPVFKFNQAISFVVHCKDQEEIDYYWEKLSADPQSEQCGWLKDKFGLSWQIVPENIADLLKTPEAVAAMLKMKKLIIKDLEELA